MTLRPVDELYGQVADVHAAYGFTDPAQRQAVEDAYAAFREHSGPFMVSIAADMLDDLRSDVRQNPDRVIAFLGRDGHSLAAAVRGLDPEFFDRHCREVVVSRAVVDAALQDLEKNDGASFPEADAFRGARKKVDPADVDGSYQHLTHYLRASGVPMGLPGSSVTVVDTSFKGTVQELMSAAYPQTEIQGRYAFLALSPDDPHPEAKQGYVLHQEPDAVWQGLPQPYLPEQRSQTFGNQGRARCHRRDVARADGQSPERHCAGPSAVTSTVGPAAAGGYQSGARRGAVSRSEGTRSRQGGRHTRRS
ncbi:hypothetical protein [Streptomyces tailanensis]|uniref:hypothetical protein n=1 Tax=Streptomyces tailanensis TaxID=2569858 RepID=UPI00122DF991|nr:hypothetical protein [Streptomyces tailanensis]